MSTLVNKSLFLKMHRLLPQKLKLVLDPHLPRPPRNYEPVAAENLRFDSYAKYNIDGNDIYPLERRLVYPLNASKMVECHHSAIGFLFLFHINNKDIAYLNSLLFDLARMKGIRTGLIHYIKETNSADESNPQVIMMDRKTRFFNRHSQSIDRCDFIDKCQARVALAIDGLYVIDSYHVYLYVTVHQMKVEHDMDAKETPDADCIF